MGSLDLVDRRVGDPHAHGHDVAPFVGRHRKAECVGVGDGEEHAAVTHVHGNGAEAFDLQRMIERNDEGGLVGELDLQRPRRVAPGVDGDQAGG